MKYIKPIIEELELLDTNKFICCSAVVPWEDDDPQEDIPEHGVPWDDDNPF